MVEGRASTASYYHHNLPTGCTRGRAPGSNSRNSAVVGNTSLTTVSTVNLNGRKGSDRVMYADETTQFYRQFYPELPCGHASILGIYLNKAEAFCGLCWLQNAWEAESPTRFHEYKLLAENGNPETSPRFWSHLKANLGLIPPLEGQDLRQFRRDRKRLYGEPSPNSHPVASALYHIMGVQPKLATPLVMFFCGSEMIGIQTKMKMTTYGLNQSMSKGIRMTLRKLQ